MKKSLLLPFLALACISAYSQPTISQQLAAVVQEASQKQVFSGNVLIIQNDQTLYQQSVGQADRERGILNKTDTKFQIGSITKFFTRILVLQLVEAQKIALSDKISAYLDGFSPAIGNAVTIEHLLDHRSGLGSYYDLPSWNEENIHSISDIVKVIQQEKLAFQPGTSSQYSNSGYVVLAAIVEKLTQQNFGTVLQKQLFDKIGLKNTGYSLVNIPMQGKAVGYLTNQPNKPNNLRFKIIGGGDGGIYSTTGDLWLLASSLLHDNRLLTNQSKVKLFDVMRSPEAPTTWQEFQEKGRMTIAGGAPGLNAVFGINRSKNYTIVVLSNYDEGSAEQVAMRLSAVMNGKTPEPFEEAGEGGAAGNLYKWLLANDKGDFGAAYKEIYKKMGVPLDDDMQLLYAGQRLIQEKRFNKALVLYQTYTQDFPQIVVAWNDLADVYLATNDKPNAIRCYQKALEVRPGNPRATNSLKKLLN